MQDTEGAGKMSIQRARAKSLDQILVQHFDGDPKPIECSPVSAYYHWLTNLLFDVYELVEQAPEPLINGLGSISGVHVEKPVEAQRFKPLDDILVEYFGSGFPMEESPWCESYGKLVELLYDVGNLTCEDTNEVVEDLDQICNEGALRDVDGELIYDEAQIREELERRKEEDYE